jgi:hypothetical protein
MHQYKITVRGKDGSPNGTLAFDFTSHEDLAELVERVQAKGLFQSSEAATFVVGLKLFSSVLLAHRGEEIFAEFAPHFGQLMKKLKNAG